MKYVIEYKTIDRHNALQLCAPLPSGFLASTAAVCSVFLLSSGRSELHPRQRLTLPALPCPVHNIGNKNSLVLLRSAVLPLVVGRIRLGGMHGFHNNYQKFVLFAFS
ncbi:UNVERIFIED_CONTAM: hypothetical protein K2H54_061189 [Gekko kuhli]